MAGAALTSGCTLYALTETRSLILSASGEEVPGNPGFLEFSLIEPWNIVRIDSLTARLSFDGAVDIRDFVAVLMYKDAFTVASVLFNGEEFEALGGNPVTRLDVTFDDLAATSVRDAIPSGGPLSVVGSYMPIDNLNSTFLDLDPSAEDWVLYVSYLVDPVVNSTFLHRWDLTITGDSATAVPDALGWSGTLALLAMTAAHGAMRRLRAAER